MRLVELAIAALLALVGLRSLWTWSRRRFEGTDLRDHLLYAVYVTGRVGLWFAFAGFFLLYAWVDASGRSIRAYQWFGVVPLALAGAQLLAGWFLGRRRADADQRPPDVSPRP